jgi:hypothetical protein
MMLETGEATAPVAITRPHCRRITRRPEHAPNWRFRGVMDRSRS